MKPFYAIIGLLLAGYLGFVWGYNCRVPKARQAVAVATVEPVPEAAPSVAQKPPRSAGNLAAAKLRQREAHSGNFVVTQSRTGGYQVRELPPGVSHMQSLGGGYGGGAKENTEIIKHTYNRLLGN